MAPLKYEPQDGSIPIINCSDIPCRSSLVPLTAAV